MELNLSILAGAIWTVSISLVLGIWYRSRCFKSSLDGAVKGPTSKKIILWWKLSCTPIQLAFPNQARIMSRYS